MTNAISINCDLGEGLDDIDAQVMPYLDLANIACGGHAGDLNSMRRTVALAQQHNVQIGAHPSYPDRENFGRVSLEIPADILRQAMHQQVHALQDVCNTAGATVRYIKPHGALYNDANTRSEILQCLIQLAKDFQLPLMLQAHPPAKQSAITHILNTEGVELIREAFADRAYTDEGVLVPRSQAHAVHHSLQRVEEQVRSLMQQGGLMSEHHNWLAINADTLCVHSDSPQAIHFIAAIHRICRSA
ncbi:hypothetical protein TDB9533_01755 [Thalassocella blandensis]|nr:hypothetical protein TDB9533_01755 [Thalassocella blandensis]